MKPEKNGSEISAIVTELSSEILNQLRSSSVRVLGQHSKKSGVVSQDSPLTVDWREDHWLSKVFVVCSGVHVGFGCHYSTHVARGLAEFAFEEKGLAIDLVQSYIAEYCNRVGGALKNFLGNNLSQFGEVDAGLSIPFTRPTYDGGFQQANFSAQELSEPVKAIWDLRWDGGGESKLWLTYQVKVDEQVISKFKVDDLKKVIETMKNYVVQDEGVLDFLVLPENW